MMPNQIHNFIPALVLALLLTTGCQNEEPVAKQPTAQPPSEEVSPPKTRTVTASKPTIEQSPAEPKSDIPDQEAEPHVVCQAFLDLLKNDNRVAAENLLTRTALAVIGRADLQLEPLGTPKAKYKLGSPMYATNKQKLAQVSFTISDFVDGESVKSDFTWMLRRQKEGWRISGIILATEPGEPQDLLSFENYDDVLQIKSSLNGADPAMTHTSAKLDSVDSESSNESTKR